MVVKVVGTTRKPAWVEGEVPQPEDPDPRQLVMAWDEAARAKAASSGSRKAAGTSGSRKPRNAAKGAKADGETGGRGDGGTGDRSAAVPPKSTKATKAGLGPTRAEDTASGRAEKAESTANGRVGEAEPAANGRVGKTEAAANECVAKTEPAANGRVGEVTPAKGRSRKAASPREGTTRKPEQAPTTPPLTTQHPAPSTQSSVLSPQSSAPGTRHPAPGTQHSALSPQSSSPAAYTGDQIQILEGVQHIRQRPGMYIGTTSTAGLLHLVYEAIDNVVDEFNAGHGALLEIVLERDGHVAVRDEARGIPFDLKEWGGAALPAATWIFIKPFSGGKFESGVYKQAGGLHGVGLTVINALSAELEVDIWRDGRHFHQDFREGEAQAYRIEACDRALRGTQIRWLPDPTIFDEDATYDVETLLSRLEATACLNRGLKIELEHDDEETGERVRKTLHSKHGLADYVRTLAAAGANALFRAPISIARSRDEVSVEVVLAPDDGYKTRILSFANGVRTVDGGTHETGFRAALTRVVNDYALKWNLIKDRSKESLKPDVIQQGLSAIISVKLADPQFQGQTKNRLNNAPVEGILRSVVAEGLGEWFEANQAQAREWLKKIHLAQKARNEAQMAEELARTGQKKNGDLVDVALSKKFAACHGSDPARNELFIVEGESAGGSAKQARRSEFQAILALKGKPLNVANASLQRILDNEEIRTIISVLGTGTRHLFDLEKLRFHKIILLADADVDGSHITCLLLTLFHQEMPGLIEAGHIYLGCPPLYSVKHKGKTVWLADDEARKRYLKQRPEAADLEFKRYKGLGEMNASELRETTTDPARRLLKRVTMEDSALAARWVSDLMARENAEARRALLAKQARHLALAGNLDV